MRPLEPPLKRENGFLMVVAIMMLVVVALAIAALGFMASADTSSSSKHNQSDQAYFVAASGLEVAIFERSQQDQACTVAGLVTPNTNVTVGSGSFSITSATVYPTGAFTATLNAGITSSTVGAIGLAFTVGSIANLAPHGRIRIDLEEIDYSSTSTSAALCGAAAACVIAWRRGANGTTAILHAAAASVFQDNQCLIQSTGRVTPAVRILEATVK